MSRLSPTGMIVLGAVLVLLGFVIPLLMVMRLIASSLWLSFLAYGASVAGLFLGLLGAAWYALGKRERS